MTVLVDSFAWVEYFKGTQKGEAVRALVDGGEPLAVSVVNLIEIYVKITREKNEKTAEERAKFIMQRCEVVGVDEEIAFSAAREKISRNLGLADAIIYATAKIKKAKIITGDMHFRGFENVIFLD